MNIIQEKKVPKVSVCVVTYNQEKYIAQCLQSAVDQKTDFEFEVIVSDDCSTDSTRDIIKEFAEKYPCIVPVLREKNIGAFKNFVDTHNMAKGEYVCHLDGDDYWLPGKLMSQVSILDSEPNCNIVWHRMKIINMATGNIYNDLLDTKNQGKRNFYIKDLLELGSIATHSSKMYRRTRNIFTPEHDALDYYFDVMQIGDGYGVILDIILGAYRFGVGISRNKNATKKKYLSHLEYFITKFPLYKEQIASNLFFIFLVELKNANSISIEALKLWIKHRSLRSIFSIIKTVKRRRCLRTNVWKVLKSKKW